MSEARLFKNGLPFTQKLAENLDAVMYRVKQNKASAIMVDGDLGEGKTTLGVECAEYVHGGEIDLNVQVALGGEELMKKAIKCYRKKWSVIVYDEAGDFDSAGAVSNFNKRLRRFFQMYRALKILVIICMPRFYHIDRKLMELGVVRFLVHCHGRTRTRGKWAVYSLSQMYYIKYWANKLVVTTKCYQHGVRSAVGEFFDLRPERSKALGALGVQNKIDAIEAQIEYDEKKESLYTFKMMAERFNLSVKTVRDLVNKEGHKPELEEKKIKYFSKDVFLALKKKRDEP